MDLVPVARSTSFQNTPTTSLNEALVQFEKELSSEQKEEFRSICSKATASDVIAFVTQIDRSSQARATRCVASRLSTFLHATQQFVGIVDTFISSNPRIAALLWGGVKFAILAANNATSFFEKVSNMIMSIGKLCPIYAKFEQLFIGSVDLQQALCEYYAVIVRLCAKVVLLSRRNTVTHLLSAFMNPFESEFRLLREELDQAANVVQLYISLAANQANQNAARMSALERRENQKYRLSVFHSRSDAKKEHDKVRQWRLQNSQRQKSKLRTNIRNNLSTINHLSTWKHVYQQRAPRTAEWLHQDSNFLKWRNNDNSSILWCSGTLGVGKSVLISNVIAHLQQTRKSDENIAYHFCRAGYDPSISARSILGSLARQLMDLEIEAIDDETTLAQLSEKTCDLEASGVVDIILSILRQGRTHYLVLDGLDEADDQDISAVAKGVATICDWHPTGLKILYAGRAELGHQLFGPKSFDYQVSITKARVLEDVKQFTTVTLEQCLVEQKLKLLDPTLILQIPEVLKEVSEEIFLWTRLFIDEMCAQQNDNDILEVLRKIPRKVSGLISEKMKRVRNHDAASQATQILQYCGVLKRPLTVNEFRELLSISVGQKSFDRRKLPTDMRSIVAACCGLVCIDEEENTIEFVHQSIQQHLFVDEMFRRDQFNEHELNTHLGKLCLTYLDFDNFQKQVTRQGTAPPISIRPIELGIVPVANSNQTITRIARKLFHHQGQLKDYSGYELEQKIQEVLGDSETVRLMSELQSQGYHFLEYARSHWMNHLTELDPDHETAVWKRFYEHIIDENSLSYKPWIADDTIGIRSPSHSQKVRDIMECTFKKKYFSIFCCMIIHDTEAQAEHFQHRALNDRAFATNHFVVSVICKHTECNLTILGSGLNFAGQAETEQCIDIYLTAMIQIIQQNSLWDCSPLLQRPVRSGHVKVVEKLLAAGVDVNTPFADEDGRTVLQSALFHKHIEILDMLLTAGAKVNAPFNRHNGNTLLESAIANVDAVMVDKLLAYGANVNDLDESGRTALQYAISKGYLEIVDRLIAAGADINAPAALIDGRTALQSAISGNHDEITDKLLTLGADVNARSSGTAERTTLQLAVMTGRIAIVNKLLQAGADVNASAGRRNGRTALQTAIQAGYIDISQRLISVGADVNALAGGIDGRTALQLAVNRGSAEIVSLLLAAGADVNAPAAQDGQTSLQSAVVAGDVDIVKKLLAAGAHVNISVNKQYPLTPLQAAVTRGHLKIMDILLEAGAYIDYRAAITVERTALEIAAVTRNIWALEKLLVAGADANVPTPDGRSALQIAARMGYVEIVSCLLKFGANANAPVPPRGQTAFIAAASCGYVEIMGMLLEAGSDFEDALHDDTIRELTLEVAMNRDLMEVVEKIQAMGFRFNTSTKDPKRAAQLNPMSTWL